MSNKNELHVHGVFWADVIEGAGSDKCVADYVWQDRGGQVTEDVLVLVHLRTEVYL